MKDNIKENGQIYLMKCNNYVYVGFHTGDIYKDNYYGSGIAWTNVVNKYGKENVKRIILDTYTTKEDKIKLEKYYINKYKQQYKKKCLNIADGGQGGNLGEEVNKRISISISGKNNGMWGKKLSDESKKKISDKLKGHPNYNPKGYKHTEKAKRAISEKHLGMKHTQESIEKIKLARLNQINLKLDSAKGKHWYYNPNTNIEKMMFEKDVPIGFIKGRIPQETKGGIYYTNGKKDILIKGNDIIPEGYIKGRKYKKGK